MSNLLINDRPLLIPTRLATIIGLNESIVLQQIHYWLINPSSHLIDGRQWCYNTHDGWTKQFPFWNKRTVRRIVKSLVSKKLILIANHNKSKYDRTNWYSIDYEALDALSISPCGQIVHIDSDSLDTPIPETTTKINNACMQSININNARATIRCDEPAMPASKTCNARVSYPKCKVYDEGDGATATTAAMPAAEKLLGDLHAAGFSSAIQKSDAAEQWEPKQSSMSSLRDKWAGWGVDARTMDSWISTKTESYLRDITLDAEKRATSNPGGFLRRLIADGHTPVAPKPLSPRYEPKIDAVGPLYSRSENKAWWKSHSSEQKHELIQKATYSFPYLEDHMRIAQVGYLDEGFLESYVFKLFMEVLGRNEPKMPSTLSPEERAEKSKEVKSALSKMNNIIKMGAAESSRGRKM